MNQSVQDSYFDNFQILAEAAKMISRIQLPKKQQVIMCDTSEHATDIILLTEDYTDTIEGPHKFYAIVAFSSRQFTSSKMSLAMQVREFLATRFVFDQFGHTFWALKEPVIVATDKMAITRLFQESKYLRNSGIFATNLPQFHFIVVHVPGTGNPAADYFSRL